MLGSRERAGGCLSSPALLLERGENPGEENQQECKPLVFQSARLQTQGMEGFINTNPYNINFAKSYLMYGTVE